ncbi:MAG: potassium channel protein [Proteobacteria bacterium]|nr:potassium channel protein [Pseudomonadota bacterium]MBU1710581.1 potassium channel protein [Pseudomonadota bacterium]
MKKIVISSALLLLILLFGTYGYMFLEGCSFSDGLYMTMITITTVGYGEVVHLTPVGKYFTMLLILIGVGFVLYLVSKVTEAVVEGGLRRIFGRRNMEKKVSKLKNHYIVCGFGRIGKVICKNLQENQRPFVVIDTDPQEVTRVDELGYLVLEGQASDDDVLMKAGIMEAKGLIAVVSSDADNVYIILSARGLNPALFIMARSSGIEGTETKLLRAGANKVISPYHIGAVRMAQLVVRPTVVDFLDLTVHGGELGLRLEELRVTEKAGFINSALMDSDIRKKYDLIVVAIKREHGDMLFNPNPKTNILLGDILVVLGTHDNIAGLESEL